MPIGPAWRLASAQPCSGGACARSNGPNCFSCRPLLYGTRARAKPAETVLFESLGLDCSPAPALEWLHLQWPRLASDQADPHWLSVCCQTLVDQGHTAALIRGLMTALGKLPYKPNAKLLVDAIEGSNALRLSADSSWERQWILLKRSTSRRDGLLGLKAESREIERLDQRSLEGGFGLKGLQGWPRLQVLNSHHCAETKPAAPADIQAPVAGHPRRCGDGYPSATPSE